MKGLVFVEMGLEVVEEEGYITSDVYWGRGDALAIREQAGAGYPTVVGIRGGRSQDALY